MGIKCGDLLKRLPADLQYFVSLSIRKNPLLWVTSGFGNDQKTNIGIYQKTDASDQCRRNCRRHCTGDFDLSDFDTLCDGNPGDFYGRYEIVVPSLYTACQHCHLRYRCIPGDPEACGESSGYLACRSSKVQGNQEYRTRQQEGKKEKPALDHGLGADPEG